MNIRETLKIIGPGMLFASSSIGTSHLVLSTRAGAHHGMIYFWIILACLLLKYPFFEFAPRYVAATGNSLLKGYRNQGMWAVVLFILIIGISMFAVVGAIGAVTAGLLSTMGGLTMMSMSTLTGIVLAASAALLFFGGYKFLDRFVTILSVLLTVALLVAFVAVIFKGPVAQVEDFVQPELIHGAGLALLISLIGWMPSGMEASAMHSFWVLEKEKVTGRRASLKESLIDFNLGYGVTVALAVMFMTIGAYTVYGSGNLLDGNATQFSNKLLNIFTSHIGQWAFPVIVAAALGTIYGTLIAAWDAFSRSFVRALRIFKYGDVDKSAEQAHFVVKYYKPVMLLIGLGAFLLFKFASSNMFTILQGATIFSFIASPILAYLNLRAIQSDDVGAEFRPEQWKILLAWIGLIVLVVFGIYYTYTLFAHGVGGH